MVTGVQDYQRRFGRSRFRRRTVCPVCDGFWSPNLDRFHSCGSCKRGIISYRIGPHRWYTRPLASVVWWFRDYEAMWYSR